MRILRSLLPGFFRYGGRSESGTEFYKHLTGFYVLFTWRTYNPNRQMIE